jgi:hypothetical protein
VAKRQMHPARLDALQAGQQMRVERGLQYGARLRRPGQLGVDDLIVDPIGTRCSVWCGEQVGPDEEIRAAEESRTVAGFGPASSGQRALIDELDAGPDGLRGRLRAVGLADLYYDTPIRAEPVEHGCFVYFAAPH